MKNLKYFVLSLIIGASLAIVSNASAEVFFSRLPTGTEINENTPINIEVSFDDYWNDTGLASLYWGYLINHDDGGFSSYCESSVVKTINDTINLPVGNIFSLQFVGYENEADCLINDNYLEGGAYFLGSSETQTPFFTITGTQEQTGIYTGGLFLEQNEIDGNPVGATTLLASVADATKITTTGLRSPLATVLAIILAFIAIRFLITTIRSSDYESKNKKQ